ncbi:MAG: hypothetical protein CMM01_16350 [Rhodopirellula sp.]|nr:hypothetical protein [Rhodopirellula sp.]
MGNTSKTKRARQFKRSRGLQQLEDRRLMIASGIPTIEFCDEVQIYGPVQVGQFSPADTSVQDTQTAGDVIARIVDGQNTSDFPAVGMVGDLSGGYGSGTLISPIHVLTAGHCAVDGTGNAMADTAGTFEVNGRVYQTSRVFLHPNYDDWTLANDIAIFQLSEPVVGVSPEMISRLVPVVGQDLTIVGFGGGGTGATGHTGDYGTKRVGETVVERVTATEIQWTFDPGESNTAPGDSGGPGFITVDGQRLLAGVTSYGTSYSAAFGDQSGDIRVDAFAEWIDSIVGDAGNDGGGDDVGDDGGGVKDDHGDDIATATELQLDEAGAAAVDAVLEEMGDRDMFTFEVDGLSNVAIALKSPEAEVDTYLRLYDANGNLIAENDDFGGSYNSNLDLELQAGTYAFSAAGYADGETGNYTATVKVEEVTSGQDDDTIIVDLNAKGRGRVEASLNADQLTYLSFEAINSGRTTVRTVALTEGVDTVMRVLDSSGNVVATNDDYGRGLNSRVNFTAIAGEVYTVEIAEYSGAEGDFRLVVNNRSS